MTIPWLMNCDHAEDGWCLPCVAKLGEERAELLDALRATLQTVEQWHASGEFSGSDALEDWPEITKARAAIAKATGGEAK